MIGYSPLSAWPFSLAPVADAHVAAVAREVGVTPAQLLLRWSLERYGGAVIPRSKEPQRIAENARLFDWPVRGGLVRAH